MAITMARLFRRTICTRGTHPHFSDYRIQGDPNRNSDTFLSIQQKELC